MFGWSLWSDLTLTLTSIDGKYNAKIDDSPLKLQTLFVQHIN